MSTLVEATPLEKFTSSPLPKAEACVVIIFGASRLTQFKQPVAKPCGPTSR